MSRHIRKQTIYICENKGTVQLRSISAFAFATRIVQFLFFFNLKFQAFLTFFCDCTARFVSDLIGTQIVGFLMHMLIYWLANMSRPSIVIRTRIGKSLLTGYLVQDALTLLSSTKEMYLFYVNLFCILRCIVKLC